MCFFYEKMKCSDCSALVQCFSGLGDNTEFSIYINSFNCPYLTAATGKCDTYPVYRLIGM